MEYEDIKISLDLFFMFMGTRWSNIQADVCHAYHVLKQGGLNDEHIVVFVYDDNANNVAKGVPLISYLPPEVH